MEQVCRGGVMRADRAGVSAGGTRASAGGRGADAAPLLLQQWLTCRTRRWKRRCMSRCRCAPLWTFDLGREPVADETTCVSSGTCWSSISWGHAFSSGAGAPPRTGLRIGDGNDRGCDDCARAEFDQERAPGARSEMASDAQGSSVLRDEGARGRG